MSRTKSGAESVASLSGVSIVRRSETLAVTVSRVGAFARRAAAAFFGFALAADLPFPLARRPADLRLLRLLATG
jgi:hypothetical protein